MKRFANLDFENKKNMSKHLIAPSMLSADFTNLQKEIEMVNCSEADWFHLDIMDGHFVPNITFGMPIVKQMKRHATKPFDVHLMIERPEQYIREFVGAGADYLTVHAEACTHLHRTIQQIKELGIKAGVSLNPHTPVTLIENVLSDVDLVLIMSVNPGFGGQHFIPQTLHKLNQLSELKQFYNASFLTEIDGGVTLDNAKTLVNHGVDVLVAGSTVFNSKSPTETISQLKRV